MAPALTRICGKAPAAGGGFGVGDLNGALVAVLGSAVGATNQRHKRIVANQPGECGE